MSDKEGASLELTLLRLRIEDRLLKLGVDSQLRERVVEAITQITHLEELKVIADGLMIDWVSEEDQANS
jgi:hypothetical protein